MIELFQKDHKNIWIQNTECERTKSCKQVNAAWQVNSSLAGACSTWLFSHIKCSKLCNAHEVMYMGYVICKVTFANHHRTTGQSQSHMHVEKISFNPTHSTTILSTLNFETGTTGRNRYIYIYTHATLVKRVTLINWKWHRLVHVSLPNQQCKATKSVEIVPNTNSTNKEHHLHTLHVMILSELQYDYHSGCPCRLVSYALWSWSLF